jgi:hypothetical protein
VLIARSARLSSGDRRSSQRHSPECTPLALALATAADADPDTDIGTAAQAAPRAVPTCVYRIVILATNPRNELKRQEALESFGVLDSEAERAYGDIVALARHARGAKRSGDSRLPRSPRPPDARAGATPR